MLGIARNAVIDHFRTHREHARRSRTTTTSPRRYPLPREDLDERTAAVRIRRVEPAAGDARDAEPALHRRATTTAEIAAVVGLAEAAVKQRMAQALRELRTRLREGDERGAERYAT
ncbi:MAG: hypothetical protein U0168_21800 [Nannocystaceae bacterium]